MSKCLLKENGAVMLAILVALFLIVGRELCIRQVEAILHWSSMRSSIAVHGADGSPKTSKIQFIRGIYLQRMRIDKRIVGDFPRYVPFA